MKSHKRFTCLLELGKSYRQQEIYADSYSIENKLIFFYISNSPVAILPCNKTFIIKIDDLDDDLEF